MSWYGSSDLGQPQQDDPWSSIVDLMSAFALVLFLAVMFFIINYNRAESQLKERGIRLKIQSQKLERKAKALVVSTQNLKTSRKNEQALQIILAKLEEQRKKLKEEMTLLTQEKDKVQKDRDNLSALIKQKQDLLSRQQDETKKQERYAAQALASRQKCQQKLDILVAKQKKVLESMSTFFSARGKMSGIGFDPQSGKIRLGGDVLFQQGRAILSEAGKKQLRVVLDVLSKVLFKSKGRAMIAGIMIEGHTNPQGSELRNWKLSSERSLSALQFLLAEVRRTQPTRYVIFSKLFHAGAFGPFHPVRRSNGSIAQNLSRRIEIKVVFKSQKEIQNLVQQLKQP